MSVVVRRFEVEGFKSFRDRTSLRLPDTVSVLVGSNGSGKSNLTDALRWAFGERDLRSLRARDASELRFRPHDGPASGRHDGGPVTRVSVVLEQTAGAESGRGLSFTRSLDADGCETLSIDGVAVDVRALDGRLREIGLEAPLRTVIRQGEVGRLLWLRPEERAELFASLIVDPGVADTGPEYADLAERCARSEARSAYHERREGELRRELDRLTGAAALFDDARRLDAEIAAARDRLLLALAAEVGMGTGTATDAAAGAQIARELRALLERRRSLGHFDADAAVRAVEIREELARVTAARREAATDLAREREAFHRAREIRSAAFTELHQRIERRFASYFQTLVPGGVASLPITVDPSSRIDAVSSVAGDLPGVGVRVQFPKKGELPLMGLSGGQLVVVGLCLALAYFSEVASPILVLDEVEPALDEIMVRRVSRLLALLAEERQVLVVSHQRMTRETARTVFQVDRSPALGSHIKLHYDPREFRAPGHR